MPKDNLLKDAIADAKLVKETAIANAKASLEESFQPQLSKMLSQKLRNEASIEGVSNLEDTSGIGGPDVTTDDPGPTEPSKASWDSAGDDGSGSEVLPFGKGGAVKGGEKAHLAENEMEDGDIGAGDEEMGGGDMQGMGGETAVPGPGMGAMAGGAGEGGEEQFYHDGGDEGHGLDLEAIIRELENEVPPDSTDPFYDDRENRSAQRTDTERQPKDSLPEHGTTPGDDPMSGARVPKRPARGTKIVPEGEEVISRDDWGTAGQEVDPGEDVAGDKRWVKEGEEVIKRDNWGEAGEEVEPGEEVAGDKAWVKENFDLDEILREMEAEEVSEDVEKAKKIAAENAELRKENKQLRSTLQQVVKEMKDTNMLNAKLLYVNKLFRNANLNVEQKVHIVETFDRATTMREIKLLYTTLAENIKGIASARRKNSTVKAITEGMASKPIGSTKPKSPNAKLITESAGDIINSADIARMQELAGIKKSQ